MPFAVGHPPTLLRGQNVMSKADDKKRQAIFDYLEDIRVGKREPEPNKIKFLELEAKCLGMITGKTTNEKDLDDDEVNKLLGLGGIK